MAAESVIEHTGYVSEITDSVVRVNILAQSACSSCHAKGSCSVSETENKIIDIPHPNQSFHQGELVKVIMTRSMGFRAVFLGYILPFLIILTAMIVISLYTSNEAIIGLSAIALLPVYYGLLYVFRNKIREHFSFSIEKTV